MIKNQLGYTFNVSSLQIATKWGNDGKVFYLAVAQHGATIFWKISKSSLVDENGNLDKKEIVRTFLNIKKLGWMFGD